MKFKVLFLILLYQVSLSISADWIVGKAKFNSEDGDSVSFIKEQLIYEATKDIMGQEFQRLGFNSELFWKQFDGRIEESSQRLVEALQRKYKVATKGESEEYKKELREKLLKKEKREGNLSRVLSKYSLTRFSRSQKNPKLYFIEIKGVVDPNTLSSIYQQMLVARAQRHISTIYLNVELSTNQPLVWNKLGETNKEELKRVLEENWKKSFPKNYKIEIVSADGLEQLNNLFYRTKSLDLLSDLEKEIVESSIWLKVQTTIKELPANEPSKVKISLESSVVGYDLANKEIFLAQDFGATEHTYDSMDINSTPSMLANHIFAKPLTVIEKIEEKVTKIEPTKISHEVVVSGFSNISQVFEVKNLLIQMGIGQSLQAELVEVKNLLAKLKISLDEKNGGLKPLLEKLNNKRLNESVSMQYSEENPEVIVIKKETLEQNRAQIQGT